MAPGQRTFTIVPNPLGMQGLVQRPTGEGIPEHRPMTSKQAQKLHRQATRLPKRTKAEQAQYEREQKRLIKEEDEKRRASNKARMLRERKREKEQNLIEAKKRKGLPIVDVRPSQDLITRFVRGNGTAKKRDVSGAPVRLDTVREESPACDSATETAADEDVYHPVEEKADESDNSVEAAEALADPSLNPAKRLRTDLSEDERPSACAAQSPRRSQRASRTAVSALRMLDARSRESSLDVDDPVVEDLLRTQILEDSISAANSSAILQRSPAQNTDIALIQKVSPGKENMAPTPISVNTPELSGTKLPPKLAQTQLPIQHESRTDTTAVSEREDTRGRQAREPGNHKEPHVPVKSSHPPTTQSSLKLSHARTSVQQHHPQETVSNVRKPSSYETDWFEDTKCSAHISPATGYPHEVIKGDVQQKCSELGVSLAPAMLVAPSAGGDSARPRVHTSIGRQPLQETTATVPKSAGNATKLLDSIKLPPPVRCSTKSLAPADKKLMPPPAPPSSRFKRPAQQSTGPKFLPKRLQAAIPHPPLAQTGRELARELGSIATKSVLPTSTQLFVLSHLEDILPSPSQELRELEGTVPHQPPTSEPQPPLWKPPPRFGARGVQTVPRPTHRPPPQLKTPLPRQRTTVAPPAPQIRQTIEPALPFFSTQDFMLSSQDIIDLEDSTNTPSKLRGKKTPDKDVDAATSCPRSEAPPDAKKLPVEPFIYPWMPREPERTPAQRNCAQATAQKSTAIKESRESPRPSRSPCHALRKTQPRTAVCPSDLSTRGSQISQRRSQVVCLDRARSNPSLAHVAAVSPRSLLPRTQLCNTQVAQAASQIISSPKPSASAQKGPYLPGSNEENQQVSNDNLQIDKEEPQIAEGSPRPISPKASAPPKKGRFFTASNEAIQLAMEKSMRTHKEEQRKREAEQRALELLRREEQEEEEAFERKREEETYLLAELDWDVEDELQQELLIAERDAKQDKFEMEDDLEEELLRVGYDMVDFQPSPPALSAYGAGGLEQEPGACVASQETDYGDLDVTVEDLDDYL